MILKWSNFFVQYVRLVQWTKDVSKCRRLFSPRFSNLPPRSFVFSPAGPNGVSTTQNLKLNQDFSTKKNLMKVRVGKAYCFILNAGLKSFKIMIKKWSTKYFQLIPSIEVTCQGFQDSKVAETFERNLLSCNVKFSDDFDVSVCLESCAETGHVVSTGPLRQFPDGDHARIQAYR